MGAFNPIGDEQSDNRLIDTQEKQTIRFSFGAHPGAVGSP
jgi:hypothetical protein